MEKLRKIFYIAVSAVFLFSVGIGSMLVTTGLAYAENKRYRDGQASMIDALNPTIEQLTQVRVSDL